MRQPAQSVTGRAWTASDQHSTVSPRASTRTWARSTWPRRQPSARPSAGRPMRAHGSAWVACACRWSTARARYMPSSERVDDALVAFLAAVGDRADDRALALQQRRHRFVDRARRQQVPGVDRVLLADAVTAILSLVVLGGRPVELEE